MPRPSGHNRVMHRRGISTVVIFLVLSVPALSALTIKLGTVAPADSPWDTVLRHIASQWASISNGSVTLQIYAGGTAGGESDMIRLMRLGQLQAAALTQLGLGEIVPDALALNVPFLLSSQKEFEYVLKESEPYFNTQFEKAGFKMLTWAGAGWVHFFATKPISSPEQLKRLRLGVPEGDQKLLEVWKDLGFNAVQLPIPDIMAGLQSGLVDAFYSPPSAAAVFQWFLSAAHMSSVKVTPAIVGLVVDERTWHRIPAALRGPLEKAVQSDQADLERIGTELDAQATTAMVQNGLTVDPVTPAQMKEWEALGREGVNQVIGSLITRSAYTKILGYVAAYRSSHP